MSTNLVKIFLDFSSLAGPFERFSLTFMSSFPTVYSKVENFIHQKFFMRILCGGGRNRKKQSERGIMPSKRLCDFASTVIKSKQGDMEPSGRLDILWYSGASGRKHSTSGNSGVQIKVAR